LLQNPEKLMEQQLALWQDYLQVWQHTTQKFLGEESAPPVAPDTRDRRFKDPAWQESAVFDFIKQSYLVTARWLQQTVADVDGLEPHEARKLDFYTRQFVDAMAPSNFVLTNPEVLRTTLETGGANLVHGLQNMLSDLERGQGNLRISMTDYTAFEVGKNLATTPGKVVFRNELMELLQYAPTTKEVHKTPVLLIPAWINKFYILDMQPENSIVKWLVDQGHTVFVISWVNPTEELGRKRFDDYMLEGPLAALDAIEQATGEKSINAVGYCLGGTLLSITLAWLHAKGRQSRIASATYLTTMVDFTEAGELSVFIDEEQLQQMETRMSEKGYLEGADMAMTFNMLRANDLIWSFVVNNYLLGKDPFPFDLLYWNADATRMPATMHSFYLRNMYQQNKLAQPGGITIENVPIDLRTIKTTSFIVSAREDHIAPWKSTYAATQIYGGPIEFVVAASGHIAGMVNPPAKQKYSHWTNNTLAPSPDAWFEGAKETPGSWWPRWDAFLAKASPEKVPARRPGDGKLKPLADAPGEYVRIKS
jgi:polyhydroxyalkanoate synthase